jgi:hypothetical protein
MASKRSLGKTGSGEKIGFIPKYVMEQNIFNIVIEYRALH